MKLPAFWRIMRDVCCAILVAALVGMVALGVRLTQGPLAVNFLTPYLQSAVDDTLGSNHALVIDSLNLEWTTQYHRLEFVAQNVRLVGAEQSATVERLGLNVSATALLSGQLRVGLITLVKPHILFTLQPHRLALQQDSADQPDVLENVNNDASWQALHVVSIQDGYFQITDPTTRDVHILSDVNVNFRRRLNGVKASFSATAKPAAALDPFTITAKLQPAKNGAVLNFNVTRFTPDSLAAALKTLAPERTVLWNRIEQVQLPLTANGQIDFDNRLGPTSVTAHLEADSGFITLPDLYAQSLPLQALTMDVTYQPAAQQINWQNLSAEILDPASTIHVKSTGHVILNQANTQFSGQLVLQNILVDQLATYWPPSLASGGYDWITANMHGGKIPTATMDFDMTDGPAGTVIAKLEGGLEIENTNVTFLATMPPITNVSGTGTLNKDGIHFDIATGNLDNVKLEPAKIDISGFNDTIQNIDITAPLTGQLPDVLTLINRPPYKYADRFGVNPKTAIGGVGAKLTFKFPLLKAVKMDEIDMRVTANVKQVQLPKFIAGRDVKRGVGVMELTNKGLTLNGAADINALPINDFTWREDFTGAQPTSVTFSGVADATEIASTGVPVTDYMSGDTKFSGTYSGGSASTLKLDLDLRNDTVGMHELNWQKPAAVPLTAKVDLLFKPDGITQLATIKANGPQILVSGSGDLNPAGDISNLVLPYLQLGDKINAGLTYTKTADGQRWKIDGARFDAAGLLTKDVSSADHTRNNAPAKTRQSLAIKLGLGELWLKDNMLVTNVGGDFVYNGSYWSRAILDAQMANNNQLKILWQPVRENKDLSITATDIGPVLKGFGITDSVVGGKLDVTGHGDPEHPDVLTRGTIAVTDFKVVKAPVMARLISLTSPMGLLDALHGEGLRFSTFNSNFSYDDSALSFDKGKLSGGSLGLTFEGDIDLTKTPEQLHLNGTVIPLNGINNALANIPIIGAIAGGSDGGGILGANYKITGPADNPDVSVNPLSLLAPGFLRDLLF